MAECLCAHGQYGSRLTVLCVSVLLRELQRSLPKNKELDQHEIQENTA